MKAPVSQTARKTPSYVILTEASCDLTRELAERADVEIVPMSFTIDGRTYQHYADWRDLSFEDFYKKLQDGFVSVTAAVNMAELSNAMEKHLKAGQDILFLCFSSGLSSTRDACAMAAKELRAQYPERVIETVDTLSASIGQGLLVLLAGERRLAGDTLEQVRDFTIKTRLNIAHWFTVQDLMYLRRGGRLSMTSAAVGSILQIKPILSMDNEGRLITTDKIRGRKAAIRALFKHMEDTALPDQKTVIIPHACCQDDAEVLKNLVRERFAPRDLFVVPQGPVIGSHTGPGFLALVFLASHR